MFVVCITRWSTVMSLLLVMSTLSPFLLLLPTIQSSMVPVNMRQLWQPLMASNFNITTRSHGPLSKSSRSFDGTANCTEFMAQNLPDIISDCDRFFEQWISLVNKTGGSEAKYTCVKKSVETYWLNTIACIECSAEQYGPYHDSLKPVVASSCAQWSDWIPPLECHPEMFANWTFHYICMDTIFDDFASCTKEASLSIEKDHNIKDPAEELCKLWYANETCAVKLTCEQCEVLDPINKDLNAVAKQQWSPVKVACSNWSSYEPKMECSSSSYYNILLIVSIVLMVFILVMLCVLVYCMYKSGPSLSTDGGGNDDGKQSKPTSNLNQQGSSVGAQQKSNRA